MSSNELENLILTIDTREESNKQDKTRTKLIEAWAQSLGICTIEHKALELCDYSLVGEFRDHDINLGLEYKSWDNFISDDIESMEDKLTRSFELYTDVALFVDGFGSYTFQPETDSCHCILNYSDMARAGFRKRGITEPPTKTLAALEGFMETLQANGVHVRQLRSESQFPYSLYNLLVYLTNPHNLKVREISYEQALVNHYLRLPEIGYVRAKKLVNQYPNPSWLNSASEESLMQVLGRTTGLVIYQFLHNHSLETDAWKNGYHMDGTPKEPADEKPESKIKKVIHNIDGIDIDSGYTVTVPSKDANLCKTCTNKPKTCGADEDNKLTKGKDVVLCMSYENRYPSKPMSEQDAKHQAFKRAKADFKPADDEPRKVDKPKSTCLTPCDFILQFLSKNPKGVLYSILSDSCIKAYPNYEFPAILEELMQEGLCYEPRIGLIVGTNPSYPEGTILNKNHHNPQPSNNTSGKETPGTKGSLLIPDVQFIKSENKVSMSQGDSQQVNTKETAPLITSQSQSKTPEIAEAQVTRDNSQQVGVKPTSKDKKIVESSQSQDTSLIRPVTQGVTPIQKSSPESEGVLLTVSPSPLSDIITDFCFDAPKPDMSIIAHCRGKGYELPEIHKALLELSKTSMKKYKQNGMAMYAYRGVNGLRAQPDYDVITGEPI